MRALSAYLFAGLLVASRFASAGELRQQSVQLTDSSRGRDVPVLMYFPASERRCPAKRTCPVALLSPGYGVPHTGYAFLANALARSGYLVVAVQHDLPSDPPLARTGDLVAVRTPMWRRGVENLHFVRAALSRTYPAYAWSELVLIGHSNGGDISALAVRNDPGLARTLITLDNRRVALPRNPGLRVMSIRGSDFQADPGVLPTASEQAATGACIVQIPGSRHDDMLDQGPAPLRSKIVELTIGFLRARRCGD